MPTVNQAVKAAVERMANLALRGSRFGAAAAKNVVNAMDAVLGGRTTRPVSPRELENVEALLREAGYLVSPTGLVEPIAPPVQRQRVGEPQAPKTETVVQPMGQRWPTQRATNSEPPLPGQQSPYGQEIETPESSNVFAFSYDAATQTLYVTYKAHVVHADAVTRGSGRKGGSSQLRGKRGRTVGAKITDHASGNARGSMYAYLRVPEGVYDNMKAAISKGKFVWTALRMKGTLYGHQYAYQLVQGQVTPSVGGVYIPRKATSEGFRVRSVAELGTGRRGFQSSTLSEQKGFRSR
jgi:hypothetical protein